MFIAEENVTLSNKNRIGQGKYSTAYISKNDVYILSDDAAKEALVFFVGRRKHLPSIKRLGYNVNVKGQSLYKMPFYHKVVKSQHPKAWAQYKEMESLIGKCHMRYNFDPNKCIEVFKRKNEILSKAFRESVVELIKAMMNYTDSIILEISPRNMRVNSRGELILLDIIADRNTL